MALNYVKPHTDVGSGVIVADKRLYLTEDDRLVEEGHPDARWLWCTPGMQVPREQAERYGLTGGPDDAGKDEEPDEAPEQPKARRPAANKARTPSRDK